MEAPTLDEVRTRSALLTQKYPDPGGDADLQLLIDLSCPLVSSITERAIGEHAEGEAVPAGQVELARRAIALKAEQLHEKVGTAKARKIGVGSAPIASMSAGSYSETVSNLESLIKGKALDFDPVMHQVLWALCTPERQLYWLTLWDPANFGPTGHIEAFDYGSRPNYQGDWPYLDSGLGWPFLL